MQMSDYSKLKKILFERALGYGYAMELPIEIEGVNHCYFAMHDVIVEAGLEEEFQEYRKKRERTMSKK